MQSKNNLTSNNILLLDRYTIDILNLISLLFIFRGSLPFFKYPFLILYTFTIIKFVFIKKISIQEFKLFIKTYLIAIILVVILSMALFTTYKLYLEIIKDLVNTLIILSIGFFYTISINSKKELEIVSQNLVYWVNVLAILIAGVWIIDFISIYLPDNSGIKLLDHTILDYNFATIPALFGIVSLLFKMTGIISKARKSQFTFLLLVLYLQLFLSESRRCFIVSNTILFTIIVLFVASFFLNKDWISKFAKNIAPFLLILFGAFLSGFVLLKQTSFDSRTALLKKIGIDNGVGLTYEITRKYLRFINLYDPDRTIYELFDEVWKPNLDPKDPDSGWGTCFHKTIFPLSGNNVNQIPAGVKGYYLDNTCNVSYLFGGNSYSITNVDMQKHIAFENDTIRSSIFCYASEDFDGDEVFSIVSDNDGKWIGYAYYDLKSKGTWQELIIHMPVPAGRVSTSIYFNKLRASNFSNLKGHVIFAFPQFNNISQTRRVSFDVTGNNLMPLDYPQNKNNLEFPVDYCQAKLLNFNPVSSLLLISRATGDPIRNFMSNLIPEDTTYLSYKSDLRVASSSKKPGEDRILLWQFALQIFKLEYSWTQRIFGGGFSFLNWYGFYFANDKTIADYPHNPFLHILLYSGIVGLLIYCFFLYKVFYYYIKYIKEYPLLFIFFLITFFFNFFSGGSPFDHPIMGFFSILPFFIHSVHKREKEKELALNQSEDTAS